MVNQCTLCKKFFVRKYNLKDTLSVKRLVLSQKKKNLRESPRISENLRESPRISENLLTLKIYAIT